MKGRKKIRRKPGKSRNMYFNMDTQAAIEKYQKLECEKEKLVLYEKEILPAFSKLSENSRVDSRYEDGDALPPGDFLLSINADAKTLLKGERTALNFLRHLCAIATLTRKYVTAVAETNMKVLDTRKTTPGFRMLEKYYLKLVLKFIKKNQKI